MARVTIKVPDALSDLVAQAGDRMPESLARILKEPTLPTHVYRYVLDFLAARPTPDEVGGFGPTPEMTVKLQTLLEREAKDETTPTEKAELNEYERLEHLMVMIKAGSLQYLTEARHARPTFRRRCAAKQLSARKTGVSTVCFRLMWPSSHTRWTMCHSGETRWGY